MTMSAPLPQYAGFNRSSLECLARLADRYPVFDRFIATLIGQPPFGATLRPGVEFFDSRFARAHSDSYAGILHRPYVHGGFEPFHAGSSRWVGLVARRYA